MLTAPIALAKMAINDVNVHVGSDIDVNVNVWYSDSIAVILNLLRI